MTSSESREDFVLEFRGVSYRAHQDGATEVMMDTSRGPIYGVFHPSRGHTGVVLFGNLRGPADGLYEALSPELVERGVSSFRLQFRQRGELGECIGDTLAGLSFLKAMGAQRVALVGASFGGAVAIRAGTISPLVVAVATLASQTYGAQYVAELAPKHLLLVHGMADRVLGPHNAQNIFSWAQEPKELVLYPNADHDLRACKQELHDLLLGWLTARVGPEEAPAG